MLPLIHNWPNTDDSTSNEDCYFLYETCLEYKPKKILEIGTLVGKSAYAMALGSDCEIHTVDKSRDRFIVHEGFDRIIRYPNTESMEFWDNDISGFDFVFVDAWLESEDCENIFEKTLDKFWFLCHDYKFNIDPITGYRFNEKGEVVINRMLKESMKRDYDFDISEGGDCCALVKFENNGERI
jgi:hypothetical protein